MKRILADHKAGKMTLERATHLLKDLAYEDLGMAKVDHRRRLMTGAPEVLYCAGKTIPQIRRIIKALLPHNQNIMATRADASVYRALKTLHPKMEYHEDARLILLRRRRPKTLTGLIGVFSAGTADIPVAEEAALTAEFMGHRVERVYDVGVAGIHRLLAHADLLHRAQVIVVVAGMEGALAGVIGGLTDKPVIAVPTSVGYGASFGGLAPLLTMLNACSPGIGVVNIDNGFGAGYLAALINR